MTAIDGKLHPSRVTAPAPGIDREQLAGGMVWLRYAVEKAPADDESIFRPSGRRSGEENGAKSKI
ncbi:hypothetical protein [Methylobacterium platani]|uniref:hypothetical protein n=1 Tax=Methylobacterium platani TaxID=427683 RepID=UPI0018D486CE|nr:hypothetical protein [Methylobacterium platani]